MKRILLVEDDAMIAIGLVYALEQEGYDVIHGQNIKETLDILIHNTFDLAILDVQLPDGTGFEISDKLLKTNMTVIFLTVVDDEGNMVRAFEGGADDYITKPFRLRELLARVKRTLNRNLDEDKHSACLEIGKIRIDTTSGKVYKGNQWIELTTLEYRLLLNFAMNKGQLLTRNQILDNIWDYAGNFVEDNTLTVYIKRLREKLGEAVKIETVRGVGYRVN